MPLAASHLHLIYTLYVACEWTCVYFYFFVNVKNMLRCECHCSCIGVRVSVQGDCLTIVCKQCAWQRQREENTLSWCCHLPSQLSSSANKQYPPVPVAITHVCPFISAQGDTEEGKNNKRMRDREKALCALQQTLRWSSNTLWHFIREDFQHNL